MSAVAKMTLKLDLNPLPFNCFTYINSELLIRSHGLITVFIILYSFQSEDDNQNDRAAGGSNSDDHQSDEKSSSDCESEEIWNGVLPKMLSRDIESAPPLPEFQRQQTSLQKVNSLIFWFVYFLLIWQATCHLSDNGMAWLLRFLVSWLKVLGIKEKIILSFSGSLYLVRQFLNFDRDNSNKFVVCPKCTKLYKYNSCLTMVNNRQVAKTCSNTYFSRGRKMGFRI